MKFGEQLLRQDTPSSGARPLFLGRQCHFVATHAAALGGQPERLELPIRGRRAPDRCPRQRAEAARAGEDSARFAQLLQRVRLILAMTSFMPSIAEQRARRRRTRVHASSGGPSRVCHRAERRVNVRWMGVNERGRGSHIEGLRWRGGRAAPWGHSGHCEGSPDTACLTDYCH